MTLLTKTITYLLTFLCSLNLTFSQVDQSAHPLDKKYEQCCNNHHGDYGALNCAIDLSKEWDKQMNKYYLGLMNVLDSAAQNNLMKAQRQWIKYRDLEYKFSNSIHDMQGTMYLRMRAYRAMRIVRTRALELKSYYWVRTEEDEPEAKVQDSRSTLTVLKTGNTTLVLPTPDSLFFGGLEVSKRNNAQYVIEKYIDTYLIVSKARDIIGKAPLSHTEIPGENCLYRTEYDSIVYVEDYGCDSYFQTTSIEFKNYNFDEVKRIVKILLPKVHKESSDDNFPVDRTGWDESGRYYEYNSNCTLDIRKEENKIFISYGCSC